jgi:dTDP-4-amino-4,6-dideoxygalactose transaminase
MKKKDFTRRRFIATVSAGSVAAMASGAVPLIGKTGGAGKLAALGGTPVRAPEKVFPAWPYVDQKMVDAIIKTTRSGIWSRIQSKNGTVPTLEKEYAALMGTKGCVTTGSGTQALSSCVEALGISAGDEVITSPYTDMGTISSILTARALPVMADLDEASFQLDPKDVEKKINERTKAIMPVHMMGQPCAIDKIMAIAKKHKLAVIEDACQAHLAKFKGQTIGSIGNCGSFSFQTSKTIACGEGGAVIGNDEALMDKVFTVMMNGGNKVIGTKYRMNELEGAIILGQLAGAKERFETRNRNAAYLTSKLKGFQGLIPQKLYPGTDSGSFYIYAMTYNKQQFANADRSKFLKAMAAEGISLSPYIANGMHREPWTDFIMNLDYYKKMYPPERLKKYRADLNLPVCDRVCQNLVMIWASGPLLGSQSDMDDIINAIMKVYENRNLLNTI